uniref:DNAJ heat shock N-terminal domain-containing protein n=1 Tax=Solanum tuberosum TaxID=4113 RepID=M1DT74_SOLTU
MQHLSHAATPNGERKKLKDCLPYEESFQNTKMEIDTANGSVDVGLCTMSESKSFEYPDLDFSNFDKDESCFKVGVGDPFLVPTKGMFRFSHRIPSIKMTGMERDDVLEGSFELDPTSLPIYQVDVSTSSIDQSAITNFMGSVNSAENWVAPIPNQVPEPEFYKFAAERSPEKFQIEQCWAIYSDEDALPRVYLFPKTGEVWAVYKNWSAQLMKENNLEDFEYEIVEIVDVSDNYVDVKFLEWVKGLKFVYKARVEEEEAEKVVKICVSERLRFSHRIPAFRLTEERGGSLRGF